jgi:hypothetical protein
MGRGGAEMHGIRGGSKTALIESCRSFPACELIHRRGDKSRAVTKNSAVTILLTHRETQGRNNKKD